MTSWAAHWMTHGRRYDWCPWCRTERMELQPMTQPTPPQEPTETRLVLVDADGKYLRDPSGHLLGVVLTHTPNADATVPISLEVEQQCDMEHWHQVGRTTLPPYSGAWPAVSAP